jgi:hypothetical protein
MNIGLLGIIEIHRHFMRSAFIGCPRDYSDSCGGFQGLYRDSYGLQGISRDS